MSFKSIAIPSRLATKKGGATKAYVPATSVVTTPRELRTSSGHRYAIGDRTPGLKYGPDGGLDIWISRRPPGPGRENNWLPAPAEGPYIVSLRAYLPRSDLLNGAYRAPPLLQGF